MKHIHRVFSIPGLFFFASLALAQGMDPLDFAGEWRGRWENLTFGSKDSASLTVTADTALQTLEAVLDLDGNVFGGSDPAPITLTGTYDDAGFSVSGSQAPYGDLSLSGDTNGAMSGRALNVPNPGIDSVSLNGTYDQLAISMTYVVYFTFGGTANGLLTMEKQATVGVDELGPVLPSAFSLSQNYPNPFNPSTVIGYGLPSGGTVRLTVHDLLGRTVATIEEGFRKPGAHSTAWTPLGLPTGIYYYRLVVSGPSGGGAVYSMYRKLMLLK